MSLPRTSAPRRPKARRPNAFALLALVALLAPLALVAQAQAPSQARPATAPPVVHNAAPPVPDSVRPLLVFPPLGQAWFVAAGRGGRLVVDIGRADLDTKKHPERIPVIAELAATHGPFPLGASLLLRGTWGREVATVQGFDVWNGRIVAVASVSAAADSAARSKRPAIATVVRVAGEQPADSAAPTCARDSLARDLAPRLAAVRDSLVRVVRALVPRVTVYQQVRRPKPAQLKVSQVAGCFDGPRVLVVASLRGEGAEWVAERAVLVAPSGEATPVRFSDMRFEGHEAVAAWDADGDGRDDLGTRAVAEYSGATTVLTYDPRQRRFTRLAVGFQWEQR